MSQKSGRSAQAAGRIPFVLLKGAQHDALSSMKENVTPEDWALGVYALVRDAQGRVLMLQRSKKRTHFAGHWELPGGKPAARETFYETALVEAFEETGLDITLRGVAGAAECSVGNLRVALLILEATTTSTTITLSSEHEDYRWLSLDEVKSLQLRPGFDVFFERYLKREA